MRLGKEAKRDTQLIIISVLILTIVTLSVSYSAFFSVQSQTTVQKISTGTLEVVIDSTSSKMSGAKLYPTMTADLPTSSNSVVLGDPARLILNNTGTLDADFSVTIGYDSLPSGNTVDDLISFDYLNLGIYDVDNGTWVDFGNGTGTYYTTISALTASDENIYRVLRSVISSQGTREFEFYLWLAESTPFSEIGKLVYLKLDVKSTTVNGQVETVES